MFNYDDNLCLTKVLKHETQTDYFQTLEKVLAKSFAIKLFTLTQVDRENHQAKRLYSSDAESYAIGGYKPIEQNAWTEQVLEKQKPFIAHHHDELKKVFFDHALIAQLGLGSVINWPVIIHDQVLGTVNLLAEENAYLHCNLQPLEQLAPWLAVPFLFKSNIKEKI